MMKPVEYLQKVEKTIATHGNRGNSGLINAFTIANRALRTGSSDGIMLREAKRAKDAVATGLQTYVPGALFFDAPSAIQFAFLTADFNSVKI